MRELTWIDPDSGQIVCPDCQDVNDCWAIGVRVWPGGDLPPWAAWLRWSPPDHLPLEVEGILSQSPGHAGTEPDRGTVAIRFLCAAGCVFDVAFGHASSPCSVYGPVVVRRSTDQ